MYEASSFCPVGNWGHLFGMDVPSNYQLNLWHLAHQTCLYCTIQQLHAKYERGYIQNGFGWVLQTFDSKLIDLLSFKSFAQDLRYLLKVKHSNRQFCRQDEIATSWRLTNHGLQFILGLNDVLYTTWTNHEECEEMHVQLSPSNHVKGHILWPVMSKVMTLYIEQESRMMYICTSCKCTKTGCDKLIEYLVYVLKFHFIPGDPEK